MLPRDLSRATFEDLKKLIDHGREQVYRAWLAHGPGTTRDVAAKAAIDLLYFRPRTTELYQIGLLQLIGAEGHQGRYQARTQAEWESYLQSQRLPANTQLALI